VRTLDVTNKKILQGARSETKSSVVQVFVHGWTVFFLGVVEQSLLIYVLTLGN
jgi:hypothetical protein